MNTATPPTVTYVPNEFMDWLNATEPDIYRWSIMLYYAAKHCRVSVNDQTHARAFEKGVRPGHHPTPWMDALVSLLDDGLLRRVNDDYDIAIVWKPEYGLPVWALAEGTGR
jgi:hypothetical protein